MGVCSQCDVVRVQRLRDLEAPVGYRPLPRGAHGGRTAHRARTEFWTEFNDSLRYMRRTPLILAIGFAGVGWASGGGAAQILFTLFGEVVFQRGAAGIGLIWGFAGIGLVIGGVLGHWMGQA